jgi:hypothetical protein
MPGVGPAPKDPATRRRRNKPAAPTAVVTSDGELRGPDLPDLGGDEAWHSRTIAWYRTWRESAQAQTFTETYWDFLIDTALMHTVMWSKGKWEFASEVRLRGAKLGATKDDRKRLGIDVVVPAAKSGNQTGGNVTEIASRRRLLDEG